MESNDELQEIDIKNCTSVNIFKKRLLDTLLMT